MLVTRKLDENETKEVKISVAILETSQRKFRFLHKFHEETWSKSLEQVDKMIMYRSVKFELEVSIFQSFKVEFSRTKENGETRFHHPSKFQLSTLNSLTYLIDFNEETWIDFE